MELAVKTLTGKSAGKIELDDAIFGIEEIRGDILQRMVRYQLAKRQAGTHSTLSRSEVNRTTKKYIRQKGSGGARHGARNAPIFVGGGVAHGPKPRSHAIDLPKKVRRLALAHAISSKVKAGALVILDDAKLDAPKTKELAAQFGKLELDNALIIGGAALDDNFAKAARNIKNIDVLPLAGLNVYDVLRRKQLVMTKDAVEGLKARFDGTAPDQADAKFGGGDFVDDIQLIDGIGPKGARAMRAEGVGTLSAFVEMSEADRAALVEKLDLVSKDIADWVEQAKEMMAGQPPRSKVDKAYAAKLLARRAKEGK